MVAGGEEETHGGARVVKVFGKRREAVSCLTSYPAGLRGFASNCRKMFFSFKGCT